MLSMQQAVGSPGLIFVAIALYVTHRRIRIEWMKREGKEKEEIGFWEEDLETADPVGNSGETGVYLSPSHWATACTLVA